MAENAADIYIDDVAAEEWRKEVMQEIQQVESLLGSVSKSLSEIPGEKDPIMEGIIKCGTKLQDDWNSLMKGFKSAGDTIGNCINDLKKGGAKVKEHIDRLFDGLGKLLG